MTIKTLEKGEYMLMKYRIPKRLGSVILALAMVLTQILVSPVKAEAASHEAEEMTMLIVTNTDNTDYTGKEYYMKAGAYLGIDGGLSYTIKYQSDSGAEITTRTGTTSQTTPYEVETINGNSLWRVFVNFSGNNVTIKLMAYFFTVSYDLDGGSGDGKYSDVLTKGAAISEPKAPIKSGYNFVGWYDGNTKWNFSNPVSKPMTLKAKWEEIPGATATFVDSLSGGVTAENMPASQTVDDGASFTRPSTSPTRTGYTFKGWFTSQGCTDEFDFTGVYHKGDTVNIYAGWSANEYTVTFDPNGGISGSKTTVTATYDTIIAEDNEYTPARTGYTFKGWFTERENGTEFKLGATTYNAAEDITLYAHWNANNFIIKYDANGGNGNMVNTNVSYDSDTKLSKNTFTKEGCRFLGWAESADGIVKYPNQAAAGNLTTEEGTEITLFAVWGEKISITADNASQYLKYSLASVTYDGNPHSINIQPETGNEFGTITVKYYQNGSNITDVKDAGVYTVKIDILEGSDNRAVTDIELGTFTIDKRKVTITAENNSSVYGEAINSCSARITEGSLANNGDLGSISASCNVTQNSTYGNYIIEPIYRANNNYEVTTVNGTYRITKAIQSKPDSNIFTVTKVSYYGISGKDTADGKISGVNAQMEYRKSGDIHYTSVPDGTTVISGLSVGKYEIRYKETNDKEASEFVEVNVDAMMQDANGPDIDIRHGTDSLKNTLNRLTFGIFFKDTTSIDMTATDNEAGGAVVSGYYLDENPTAIRTEGELANITFTSGTHLTVNADKKFILYVKAVDKVDNVSYAYTDGISVVKLGSYASVKDTEQLKKALAAGLVNIRLENDIDITASPDIVIPDTARIDTAGYMFTAPANKQIDVIAEASWIEGSGDAAKRVYGSYSRIPAGTDEVIVSGTVILQAGTVISERTTLTLAEGGKLVIPEGVTVTNKGTVTGKGGISIDGTYINEGKNSGNITINNDGELVNNGVIDTEGKIYTSSTAKQSGNGSNVASGGTLIKLDDAAADNSLNVNDDIVVKDGYGTASVEIQLLDQNGTTSGDVISNMNISTIKQIVDGSLTAEDKIQMRAGQDVKIKLSVSLLKDKVTDSEKNAVNNKLSEIKSDGYTAAVAGYLDITLQKKIGSSEWSIISNMNNPLTLTINIPNEYKKAGCTYYIIRNHNGEYTVLNDSDTDDGTITFDTDRFSTYALAYKEKVSNQGGGNGGSGSSTGSSTDIGSGNGTSTGNNTGNIAASDTTTAGVAQIATTSPATGDSAMPMICMVVLVISLAGMIVLRKKRCI